MAEVHASWGGRLDEFLPTYEAARVSGDMTDLEQYLHPDLRFDDPQLPGGRCDLKGLLDLLGKFAGSFDELRLKRFGPCCVSADGGTLVQRWLLEGRLTAPPEGEAQIVHLETAECFEQRKGRIVRMTILARDLIAG